MSFLQRLISRRDKAGFFFERKPLGPAFEALPGDRIRLKEGPLAGQEFRLTFETSETEAHAHLFQGKEEVGHADIERNAPEASVVLWYITVQESLRQNGLAAIMARATFRRMLALGRTDTFAIRMLRLIKPHEKVTKIRNVGIAVLSRQLGFASEYDLETLLRNGNVQEIELIAADGPTPPGYRIVLNELPYVLIAFLADPATGRPFPGGHPVYNSLVSPESAMRWLMDRMIIIGNGNYVLRREGIGEMINHVAENETEAREFARRIKPVAK